MKKLIIQPGAVINHWEFVQYSEERKLGAVLGRWKCLLCHKIFLVENTSIVRHKSTKCIDCGHLGRRKPQHLLCLDRKRKQKVLSAEDKVAYAAFRKQEKLKSRLTIAGRAGELFRRSRQRAKECGMPFDLTAEWIAAKLRIGTCEKTGAVLDFAHPESTQQYNWNAPSLDRIDSSKGYTIDNVQITTWRYNQSKNLMSDAELLEFCRLIVTRADLTNTKIVRL